jgi:hypothetical protein
MKYSCEQLWTRTTAFSNLTPIKLLFILLFYNHLGGFSGNAGNIFIIYIIQYNNEGIINILINKFVFISFQLYLATLIFFTICLLI